MRISGEMFDSLKPILSKAYDDNKEIRFTYKSSAGASIGTDTVTKANTTGAYLVWSEERETRKTYRLWLWAERPVCNY